MLQLPHFNQTEKFRNQTLKNVVLKGLSHLAEDESRESWSIELEYQNLYIEPALNYLDGFQKKK